MNFIVAVISESYEKVMQKIVAETYKCQEGKLAQKAKKMVRQYEMILNDNIGEWQGFIKDIKSTIKTSTTRAKNETLQNLGLIQSTNQKLMEQLQIDTNKRFDLIQETLKQRMDGLEQLVKESIGKLLENAGQQQQ
ncbi:UNKNOWN [Stylonychia lemnae]|uniref:Uncharacterized protein n=1 Tax=Stylonychia lemnae TaxID=5949 RepID=A0A078A2Y4_STYLE|nr:UNKNOWN [Stylonychia lemnae]|eukprot:CDW75134.1 UNKNOWN [Stylonychia lemnae]